MSRLISAFILTYNSQKYLERIISQLKKACDEIIIVDSGSIDNTKQIASINDCKLYSRTFDNFKSQRTFAIAQCKYDWIVMIDSDEVPDDELISSLNQFKNVTTNADAYRIRGEWIVLGKKVHAVYPVSSPDYPVRIFDKRISNFDDSPVVHEEPSGYKTLSVINGSLLHYTFETKKEITEKVQRYSALSAQTLLKKKKSLSVLQQYFSAAAAFIKWYFVKGGWKDGSTGIVLGIYAFNYTFLKYKKARESIRI